MNRGKGNADTNKVKRKGDAPAARKPIKKEKVAAKQDPNMPKRPASAFFVFMEEFWKTHKKEHPNNRSISVVGKAGGEKWISMSEADRAPYKHKAEERKTEYNEKMEAYNKKLSEEAKTADDEEESDKSKSEVHDDDEDGDDGSDEDDFYYDDDDDDDE